MKIISNSKILVVINLVIVGIICVLFIIAGLTPYFDLPIAVIGTILLGVSSFFMVKLYRNGRIKIANILFILNLIIPLALPVYRLIGTNFREGYIETIAISIPLLLMIVLNQKVNKRQLQH
jgi:hypothetical protein